MLLQWEDFARDHAAPLLERYRDTLCTFNDDIQGTASVVVAVLSGAFGVTESRFRDQRIVIAGAGSAGLGLAAYLLQAMRSEGLSDEEARRRILLVDRDGLLHDRLETLTAGQRLYAQPFEAVASFRRNAAGHIPLEAVLEHAAATVLIGVSAQCGLFSEAAVRAMAARVERPIILPLSNPLERCEATPTDLLRWTDGRALIATGTPYAPVTYEGVTRRIAQCNNVYIFPAVGLGVAERRRAPGDGRDDARRGPGARRSLARQEGPLGAAASDAGRAALADPGDRAGRRPRGAGLGDGAGHVRGRGPGRNCCAVLDAHLPSAPLEPTTRLS